MHEKLENGMLICWEKCFFLVSAHINNLNETKQNNNRSNIMNEQNIDIR